MDSLHPYYRYGYAECDGTPVTPSEFVGTLQGQLGEHDGVLWAVHRGMPGEPPGEFDRGWQQGAIEILDAIAPMDGPAIAGPTLN